MTEKKYLRWYNKIGYGSGDIAGNVVYALLSSFVTFYLTSIVGLNIGIVGTLMAVSKIFDGITDVFFGSLIDKTNTRMGKARPWMIYGYIGCAVTLAAIFMIPTSWDQGAQYAYFFITYTLLNAVFYTANNIAYASLTALITKNGAERVQLGSIRFMFAFATSMLIQFITFDCVELLGGGAQGWKYVAIIYAVIGLVINTISGLSVKELAPEELESGKDEKKVEEKYTLLQAGKLLVRNKYYILITCVYILAQLFTATLNMGVFFMQFVLGDKGLLGTFSLAINVPLIIGLMVTPVLVKKMNGMYKLNMWGYALSVVARGLVIAAGYMRNVPLMLLFSSIASLGMSPLQGDLNALIAECSEYTWLTQNKRIDGTMYSCSSLGTKIGGGIGTALTGWLLAAAGFIEQAAVQPEAAMNMLHVLYLWLPMILNLLITFLLSKLKVEQANKELSSAKQ